MCFLLQEYQGVCMRAEGVDILCWLSLARLCSGLVMNRSRLDRPAGTFLRFVCGAWRSSALAQLIPCQRHYGCATC